MIFKNISVFALLTVFGCAALFLQQRSTLKVKKALVKEHVAPFKVLATQPPPALTAAVQPRPLAENKPRISVYFCVPVKSTPSMQHLNDTELINTMFPTLAQSFELHEIGKTLY